MAQSSGFDWSGVLGGVGSLVSGIGSLFGSNDTYEDQVALMERNNRFQSEENQKSRDWQQSMYDRQWQDYQSYNDPAAMSQRLQKAGVTPASAFQSMSTPSGASSMPSPSSPGHTASPSPDYAGTVNPVNQKAAAFSSIAQGLQALANARKLGVEGSKVGEMMSSQIKGLMAKADYDEVQAEMQNYELSLRRKYGDKMLDAQVHELAMRAFQAEEMAKYYIRQEDVQKAESELKNAQTLHERVKKRLSGAQADMYESDARFRDQRNRAEIGELKSRSAMQSVSAEKTAAETEFQKMSNEVRRTGLTEEKTERLTELVSKIAKNSEQRQAALNALKLLQRISRKYDKSEAGEIIDAGLKNLFDLLGLSTNAGINISSK